MNRMIIAIAASITLLQILIFCPVAVEAQGRIRERLRQRMNDLNSNQKFETTEKIHIAGLDVAVWRPKNSDAPAPLVIFSHGFHGMNTQSKYLMKALASAGYLVLAPNHKDATKSLAGLMSKPEEPFKDASKWTDQTYEDRCDNIKSLVDALHTAPEWKGKIDWGKFALAGHSLGGYTALGCAGAWPSWKIDGVKAVLLLAPYATPFAEKNALGKLGVPVMYQGGTKDFGITPFVKRKGGAYDKTGAPAYFVEFDGANHYFWTDFNRDQAKQDLVDKYSLAFLNKYLLQDKTANPEAKLSGVIEVRSK